MRYCPAPDLKAGLLLFRSGPVVAVIGIVAILSSLNAYIIATSRVLRNVSAR